MNIDKDLVQKAVDEAFAKIMDDSKKYDDDEIIYSDEDEKKEKLNDIIDDKDVEDIEEKEDVQDKIEKEVEDAVDENSDYNFLGLDISIEKTEDGKKFNVKITKDGKEKVEVLDSIELPNILGLIEDFFNELVLEDSVNEENDEEISDEDTEVDMDEDESEELENEEEDEELTESYHAPLASLRRRYKNKIEEFFEHGLLAKELALEMVKNNLTRNTVKELIETVKEKDSIIASKKADLQKLSVKYLQAKKMENSLKKAHTVLGSVFKDLNEKVENKEISPATAKKVIKKYKTIISSIMNTDDPKAIIAAVNTITKVQNAILSNVYKSKFNKGKSIESITSKPRNVLNKEGKVSNTSLLSNRRYDGIDEMSAEILRIAGINNN